MRQKQCYSHQLHTCQDLNNLPDLTVSVNKLSKSVVPIFLFIFAPQASFIARQVHCAIT